MLRWKGSEVDGSIGDDELVGVGVRELTHLVADSGRRLNLHHAIAAYLGSCDYAGVGGSWAGTHAFGSCSHRGLCEVRCRPQSMESEEWGAPASSAGVAASA